jgi:anhydro-N-acetylmuramic acid kinase
MKVIGLMSGTSADGVDAALVEIDSPSGRPAVRLLAFEEIPYPAGLRQRILALASGGGVEELCHLNAYLGELFAEGAGRVAGAAGVPLGAVDLIGSHGQTVHHLPAPRQEGAYTVRSTLQIGSPAVIAERTGVTTVADFRMRDMAAGGEGAPLTPLVHHLLFGDAVMGRAVLNLGGIANLTVLPPGGEASTVSGFDTGPGNVLLDEYVRITGLSEVGYDPDGRLASAGTVVPPLLAELLAHPFIRKAPPKSTGRETFGPAFVAEYRRRLQTGGIGALDGLATLAVFTTDAVAENLRRFVAPRLAIRELIVMGGGARNRFLVRRLAAALPECRVRCAEELGHDARAVEAIAFAVLAYLTAAGRAGNLPAVTGATGPRVLGCIVPGARFPGLGRP